MRKRMKFVLCILMAAAVAVSSGCAQARELNDLVIVMGIGMDVDPNAPDNVLMVAQIVQPQKISSGSDSSGSNDKAFVNMTSSAEDTFEAVRDYTHIVTGKLYISHNQIIIFGRDFAERGISRALDFFVRAKETRPTIKLIVADTTAKELLDEQPELNMMPAIYIDKLIEAQENNAQAETTDLIDYINAMQSKTLSLVLPIVKIEQNGENKVQKVDGMAVFKQDRMVGELTQPETRGLLWVNGQISGGLVNVSVDDGLASLEIMQASSKTEPVISEDGKVTIRVNISTKLRLAEQTCSTNLSTQENLSVLEDLVVQTIISKIEMAFAKAKALNADVFGFGELIHKHQNDVWADMEPRWEEIFPTIALEVKVNASVISVGSIEEPAWDKEGE